MEHLVIYEDSLVNLKGERLREKIAQMCARFRQKFGEAPTEFLALPSAIDGFNGLEKIGPVKIKPKHNALIHHFWIGRNDESVQTTAAS